MTKSNYRNGLLLIACWVIFALPVAEARSDEDRPKLILQITIDQLRGDLPGRYLDHMGEGGFQQKVSNRKSGKQKVRPKVRKVRTPRAESQDTHVVQLNN